MSNDFTYCNECDHLSPGTKSQAPYRWLCTKHPRHDGFGFVTREAWDDRPPFLYCKDVNAGACPIYEPKREDKDNG